MAHEPLISTVIGRMLMVGVRGTAINDPEMKEDLDACRAAHVGGVILFDVNLATMRWLTSLGERRADAKLMSQRNIRSPRQVIGLNTGLRRELGEHLLIGVDQEGGQVMRLSPGHRFAGHVSAATASLLALRESRSHARALWREVSTAGFNVNFTPCVDVGVNPDNSIVVQNGRCFSSAPRVVAMHARRWLEQADDCGVAACLKHFPGHGSSANDSHEGFVDITNTFQPEIELAPYRELIGDSTLSVPMVMTGHLFDANVDANHPASLSHAHTTRMLREEIGFDGVVVTDSLDMGAITKRYVQDEACVLAVNAGADILLDANNPPEGWRECPAPAMHEAIMRALSKGQIVGGEERLRTSWRRIERMMDGLKRRA